MAVSTSRPDAPVSSPTAKAAGTTGALACSEESACVSSKSREWPSAPLSRAATAGVQVLLSPNTVATPLPSSASDSEAAMPNVVYKGFWSVTFRNGAHDRLLETPVRLGAVPEGTTGPGAQGHRGGCRRVRDRERAASDVAAMGGADVAYCHSDERRPIAEGDPRLYARDRGRRDLWRRHR